MTTQQHEALHIADALDAVPETGADPDLIQAAAAELRRQHARIADLEAQHEAIGAGGVSGPLIGQPQAMPDLSQLTERGAKAWAGVDAQGLRDGGASLSANAGGPSAHIKEPYTIAEIKAKIDSNDYSAEMLLQHAMLLLDSASLSANAGQAGEYPALVCDYCGALTPDPWHSSGMLHGKMSKHIHSCDACAARGAAEAQAADSVTAPAPPPECETEAEKRAFAFGWFKALESERMKAESVQEDAAFEAVRKKLCALPRYSFVLDDDGLVRRVQDRSGNWIEFDDAHELFDPVAVDAARKQGETQ